MAVTSSGEIKLSDLQTEFGGSSPIAFSEYHFNASGPNTNGFFPNSGEINLASFYGATNTATSSISSSTTDVSLATTFGVAWAKNGPKVLNIDSGVTIGATTGNPAVMVSSGMAGTLVVNNAGTISGHGGAGGATSDTDIDACTPGVAGNDGGDGGHGISVASTGATINNTGTISGGGGGGGGGGAGERGSVTISGVFRYYAGRPGGAGGNGAGYNQSATNGSNGLSSPGPSHNRWSGAGGDGGNGGAIGSAGEDGENGGNNSRQSCTAGVGGSGGAAGKAINNGGATWTNGTTSGTYNGAYT
jgi:hypothetical protein|tara:strand:- start:1957 stop:2865 length:909 start_codon:yes stop_codon:yes gene_type:complete